MTNIRSINTAFYEFNEYILPRLARELRSPLGAINAWDIVVEDDYSEICATVFVQDGGVHEFRVRWERHTTPLNIEEWECLPATFFTRLSHSAHSLERRIKRVFASSKKNGHDSTA